MNRHRWLVAAVGCGLTTLGMALGTALATTPPIPPASPVADPLLRLDGSAVSVAEIDRQIPDLMSSVWLPGLSVVVVRDGAIVYRRSFGVRDSRTGSR